MRRKQAELKRKAHAAADEAAAKSGRGGQGAGGKRQKQWWEEPPEGGAPGGEGDDDVEWYRQEVRCAVLHMWNCTDALLCMLWHVAGRGTAAALLWPKWSVAVCCGCWRAMVNMVQLWPAAHC